MNRNRRFSLIALLILLMHILVPFASAHPLGNFTINHYAGLHVEPDGISIDYVLDMAEIPAFQEIASIDANRNGRAEPEESAGYHPAQCESIRNDLDLRVATSRLPLTLVASAIEYPPGQAGLPTLRLTCAFAAAIPSGMSEMRVEFKDHSYATRLGWREIVVTGEGVSLQGEFSDTSLSHRLTDYPEDLLISPLSQSQVFFQVGPAANASQGKRDGFSPGPQPISADKNDAFTRLVLVDTITLPTLVLAILVSFIWGGMHALTPGHGKTIVGAYLVGARGTARHALYLGLATTIAHTTGVFILGLVTLFAARFVLPEVLFPWLSFVSGLLVMGIGANLFFSRLRATGLLRRLSPAKDNDPDGHHGHDHHHIHDHSHDHAHDHKHASHLHHLHPIQAPSQDDDTNHSHGSHLPPGADGSPVTWRSLLALGISGGLLPCPSALVVLLSAIALNRVGFGLVLVFAFSLGLAGVLSAIGLLFVYAGRLFNRIPVQSPLLALVPALSALFITLVGLGITARALIDTGFINI